jgi:site-specific DNA-methyltransferase (adenine-specific)
MIDLRLGDCLEVMPTIPSGSVDLVFTSPPYNLGTTSGGGFPSGKRAGKWSGGDLSDGYGAHNDAMPHEEYVAWQKRVLTECWRLLSDEGAIFYNHKPRVQFGELWTPLELNPGLPIRQIIIWQRSGGLNYSPTFYVPTHEWIIVFAKPGFRLKSKAASGLGDVWTVPQDSKNPHPAPFPFELPRRALQTTNAKRACDPFMGSGTTGAACEKAGCDFLGIDNDPKWIEYARRRIKAAETPLFSQDLTPCENA